MLLSPRLAQRPRGKLGEDDNLVALPDGVPFDLGATATDAGLTACHAIMTAGGAKKGMKIGVIGCFIAEYKD